MLAARFVTLAEAHEEIQRLSAMATSGERQIEGDRVELTRLREENARLRETLERIAEETAASWIADLARQALESSS